MTPTKITREEFDLAWAEIACPDFDPDCSLCVEAKTLRAYADQLEQRIEELEQEKEDAALEAKAAQSYQEYLNDE